MQTFAEQVWFRTMPEEQQRFEWQKELTAKHRKIEEENRKQEEARRQKEHDEKMKALRDKKKKVQATAFFCFYCSNNIYSRVNLLVILFLVVDYFLHLILSFLIVSALKENFKGLNISKQTKTTQSKIKWQDSARLIVNIAIVSFFNSDQKIGRKKINQKL